jgi:hypothetical protein
MNRRSGVRINPVKNPVLSDDFSCRPVGKHVVVHRSHPERTSRIRAPVIQPDLGPSFKPEHRFVPNIRNRFPQNHAGAERDYQHVVAIGESDRSHRFFEKPCADTLIGKRETMDQKAVDVRPVNRGVRSMPDRAFTALVAGGRHANWRRSEQS